MIPKIRFSEFEEEWIYKPLTEEVTLFGGLTYAPSDIKSNGTLVLRSSNVQNGEISLSDCVFVDSNIVNTKNVEIGDIIVVVRNGSRALIGKHATIKREMPFTVIGAFMTGIKCKNPEFLNALLSTKRFDKAVNDGLGATINQITNATFQGMKFYFPNEIEQTKIGSFFTLLDETIRLEGERLASLKQVKAASLQSFFPQEGEKEPRVRFKGFSGEWKKVKIGEIFKERNEQNIHGEMLSVTMNNGIIKASENGRFDNSNDDKSHYKVVKIGDIAYNSMRMWQGASGCSAYEGIVSPAYTVLNPQEGIDSLFFSYLFKCQNMLKVFRFNSQGLTSDTWNLKYPTLSQIEIQYPESLAEQHALSTYFTNIDEQIRLVSEKIEKMKKVKGACLERMMV